VHRTSARNNLLRIPIGHRVLRSKKRTSAVEPCDSTVARRMAGLGARTPLPNLLLGRRSGGKPATAWLSYPPCPMFVRVIAYDEFYRELPHLDRSSGKILR
jgi:hypothetical protein